ncbi:MAG: hypothetical protein KDC35_21525 [Acidobacteria bacterium]|nr:hypothetical protein [Acidobacteriota bacterium]
MNTLTRRIVLVFLAATITVSNREAMRLSERSNVDLVADMQFEIDGVLNHHFGGPYGYRVLVPYSVHALSTWSGITPTHVDWILQFLWVLIALELMWAVSGRNHLIVALLAFYLVVCQSYIPGPSIAETQDVINLAVFLGFIHSHRKQHTLAAMLWMALGLLNKETPFALFIYLGYWLFVVGDRYARRISLPLIAIAIVTFVALHLAIPSSSGSWFQFKLLHTNFWGPYALKNNLYALLLLAPLIGSAVKSQLIKPSSFNRSILATVGFLIAVHYVFGVVRELRLWLPVIALLLIASGPFMRQLASPPAKSELE